MKVVFGQANDRLRRKPTWKVFTTKYGGLHKFMGIDSY